MKNTRGKYQAIMGQVMEIMYDGKMTNLNLELAKDKIGTPIIVFQDWTKKDKSKDLFRLHIKEAVAMKAVIDSIIIDYYEQLAEKNSLFNEQPPQEGK